MMRSTASIVAASFLAFAAFAQMPSAQEDPHQWKMTASDTPTHISEHVWVVKGNPNIAIIVGSHSAMVVDTGMGPAMGKIAAGFAEKLAPGKRLYLTTTHFHPEHAAGDSGFPADTILIRNDVQQMEVEHDGMDMVKAFMQHGEENRELLKDTAFRNPDVTFHDEAKVDLGGGVTVRLMWLGGAHTEGDELTFVEPDKTLISGDVVQNATMPGIYTGQGKGGTPTSWLHVVEKLEALHAEHVVPDHSYPGDGSLVAKERELIAEIRTNAIAMKKRGVSADEAGTQISAKLKQEHPDWHSTNASGFVKSVYSDQDTSTE
jgi:glyoxylase-like metal-dependent hydrolase (beta-lactamase superfamily II)